MRISPLALIERRLSIRLRSTRADGAASRSFIAGSNEWPPARIFASGSCCKSWTASSTDDGRW
jgi:hypothetical protein